MKIGNANFVKELDIFYPIRYNAIQLDTIKTTIEGHVTTPQDILDLTPEEITNKVNELAGKLAGTMGWKMAPGTLFYLPAEKNGPLLESRPHTYWSLAITAYEEITGVDVQTILHEYLESLSTLESN